MRLIKNTLALMALAGLTVAPVAHAQATRSGAALPSVAAAKQDTALRASKPSGAVSYLQQVKDDDDDDQTVLLLIFGGVAALAGIAAAAGNSSDDDDDDNDSFG